MAAPAYPAELAFQIRRIRGFGDFWVVVENSISYDGGDWNLTFLNILEFRGDKVAHESI